MTLSFLLVFSFNSFALETSEDFFKNSSDVKVLVFLSKDCPCSKSHVEHLNQLHQDFSSMAIFGVIADPVDKDEAQETADYFSSKNFKFPLLNDPEQKLIKQFKALKTPHVVVLKKQPSNNYTVIYEGGVSDQRKAENASVFFLRENLQALQNNKHLPFAQGKSLGCYIRRI
jgi:peroxiredoxin